jgi:hypothetical protein
MTTGTDDSGRTEVSYYMIHPNLKPRLDEWLEGQGFRVSPLPPDIAGRDKLPTFLVSPGARRFGQDDDDGW